MKILLILGLVGTLNSSPTFTYEFTTTNIINQCEANSNNNILNLEPINNFNNLNYSSLINNKTYYLGQVLSKDSNIYGSDILQCYPEHNKYNLDIKNDESDLDLKNSYYENININNPKQTNNRHTITRITTLTNVGIYKLYYQYLNNKSYTQIIELSRNNKVNLDFYSNDFSNKLKILNLSINNDIKNVDNIKVLNQDYQKIYNWINSSIWEYNKLFNKNYYMSVKKISINTGYDYTNQFEKWLMYFFNNMNSFITTYHNSYEITDLNNLPIPSINTDSIYNTLLNDVSLNINTMISQNNKLQKNLNITLMKNIIKTKSDLDNYINYLNNYNEFLNTNFQKIVNNYFDNLKYKNETLLNNIIKNRANYLNNINWNNNLNSINAFSKNINYLKISSTIKNSIPKIKKHNFNYSLIILIFFIIASIVITLLIYRNRYYFKSKILKFQKTIKNKYRKKK